MRKLPKISVIVPTYNRKEELNRLLLSMKKQSYQPGQIIIVDASELEGCIQLERCNLIKSKKGAVTQRNIGLRHAQEEIVLFLDDDAVLTPCCLELIAREFEADISNEIGAITGRIITYNNIKKKSLSLARAFGLGESRGDGSLKLSGFPSLACGENDKEVDVLCGGIMAFRRSVIEKLGGFDEKLEKISRYSYMEDQDIAIRIKKAGFKIKYIANVRIYHFPSTRGRDSSFKVEATKVFNSRYILRKHFKWNILREIAWLWAIFGMIIGQIISLNFKGLSGLFSGLVKVIAPEIKCEFSFKDLKG